MRCYSWRLVEALFVGLLLAALAVAWREGHLALWPHGPAGSAVSAPASPTERDGGCLDSAFDAMAADHHGGAVVTAC
ncbi:MAG: hypothetical protein Q7W02_23665 [Candidatus Rokubacteria bacterium]|nr:hypothetical protein [Candidatus Rokubacteria bacterium]